MINPHTYGRESLPGWATSEGSAVTENEFGCAYV